MISPKLKEITNMGQQMNEAIARSNVNYFPERQSTDDPAVRELNFLGRRLHEAGVIEMAPSTKPPGFFVNWTTVTSLVVVVSAIVGLWYFTWQAAEQAGYHRGKDEIEKQQLLKQIDDAKRDAAEAKKLQTYAAGVADTHSKEKK